MNKNSEIKKTLLVIENDMNSFEPELRNIINCKKNFLTDKLNSFLFNNPKRLRPIFTFLFAKILKIDSILTQKIALALELIHSASLIHDDIIDEDSHRRGQKTFHIEFNQKIAILEGDFLLSLALEELSQTSIEIIKIFSNKITNTIQGEILQNENISKTINLKTYFEKTYAKTGNIFMAGLEALFTLKEIDDEIKVNLVKFVENFSLAFQIKNDVDNFSLNLSDIKNGNYTLPMLYFNMDCENEFCDKYILKAKQKVQEFHQNAQNCLLKIEESEYKKALLSLINIVLGD